MYVQDRGLVTRATKGPQFAADGGNTSKISHNGIVWASFELLWLQFEGCEW